MSPVTRCTLALVLALPSALVAMAARDDAPPAFKGTLSALPALPAAWRARW